MIDWGQVKWLRVEENWGRVLRGRRRRRSEEVCGYCGKVIRDEEVALIKWEEDASQFIGYRCAELCEACKEESWR